MCIKQPGGDKGGHGGGLVRERDGQLACTWGARRGQIIPLHPPGEQPNNPTRCTYAIEFRGNNPRCLATTTGG